MEEDDDLNWALMIRNWTGCGQGKGKYSTSGDQSKFRDGNEHSLFLDP